MNVDINRDRLAKLIRSRLRSNPVVMLLGPRQCGKTTIARAIAGERRSTCFDLEAPADRRRLTEPMTALERLRGLVVIDEAQLQPDLFPVLRVLADRKPVPARFLLLGSASPDLAKNVSESLAGRVAIVPMGGFDLDEVGDGAWRTLWWRGGFPRSFLARSNSESLAWRNDFVQTFLERDLARFGVQIPPLTLRRLWTMVAHNHGQILNSSELGRSLGESHTTVRRHLDVLNGAFVVRLLQPWHENLGKRQVKSPKVYVRDSGVLHALLDVASADALESHPKLGASWEGFALEQVLQIAGERDAWFWATQAGAELDLLVQRGGKRYGFEFKWADAPAMSKSMHVAHEDLGLARLFVITPGGDGYDLAPWAEVVPLSKLRGRLAKADWR